MKITIEKTQKVEVEISFPYYTKDAYHYFKFIDEYTCVSLYLGIDAFTISKTVFLNYAVSYTPSSEQEFNEKLQIITFKINEI